MHNKHFTIITSAENPSYLCIKYSELFRMQTYIIDHSKHLFIFARIEFNSNAFIEIDFFGECYEISIVCAMLYLPDELHFM